MQRIVSVVQYMTEHGVLARTAFYVDSISNQSQKRAESESSKKIGISGVGILKPAYQGTGTIEGRVKGAKRVRTSRHRRSFGYLTLPKTPRINPKASSVTPRKVALTFIHLRWVGQIVPMVLPP